MSNEIDWAGRLECDEGPVQELGHPGVNKELYNVQLFGTGIFWHARKRTGVENNQHLGDSFTVRNVKTNRDKAIELLYKETPHGWTRCEDSIDILIKANLLRED